MKSPSLAVGSPCFVQRGNKRVPAFVTKVEDGALYVRVVYSFSSPPPPFHETDSKYSPTQVWPGSLSSHVSCGQREATFLVLKVVREASKYPKPFLQFVESLSSLSQQFFDDREK